MDQVELLVEDLEDPETSDAGEPVTDTPDTDNELVISEDKVDNPDSIEEGAEDKAEDLDNGVRMEESQEAENFDDIVMDKPESMEEETEVDKPDNVVATEEGQPESTVDESDLQQQSDEEKGNEEGALENQSKNKAMLTHLKRDAELEAYLESLKPKPKRKSIKEMLLSMPQYKDVVSLKPKIGGGCEKKDVIYLDEESMKKESAKDAKFREQIEKLKDRFVKQVLTQPQKHVKDHVKLKIKKKEEDSQGLEHLVENEVEYIRNPLNEEEDAVGFLSTPQNDSPKANKPGTQRRRIQEVLLAKIRAQKKKEHEERVKLHAMDNEEEEKEEIIEDEGDSSDEDSELGEEEEELEYLLAGSGKKKKKSKYIDDEAEDEDDDDDADDNEDDDDDDDDEEDEEEDGGEDVDEDSVSVMDKKDASAEDSQGENKGVSLKDSHSEKIQNAGNIEGSKSNEIAISPLVVLPKIDAWSRSKLSEKDALMSPLLQVLKKSRAEQQQEQDSKDSSKVPESLAAVITNTDNNYGNLADLCSGRFVSQIDNAALDSDEDDEYSGFDFGDDDGLEMVSKDKNDEPDAAAVKTPVTQANSSRMAVDGVTPKLSEKVPKTRLLMQFDEEAEKESCNQSKDDAYEMGDSQKPADSDDEGEDGDVISSRRRVLKNKKRLQFSDDEDDGEETSALDESNTNQTESENEEEEEEELDDESQPVEQPKSNPFFNKFGRLKRKFVEDEAELSGSEEGSDDEDERGLNHYEMEEGDDEELDEESVRKEVERAHLQRVIDDDDRQIRILQEHYLKDGEFHSDKRRERKFRWSNINAMDDDAVMGDSDDEEDKDENPEELEKKREWIEKRKWMSENSHLLETDEDESQSLFTNSRFLKISKSTLKRIESFVETSTSDSSKDGTVKESYIQRKSILEEIIKAKTETKKNMTSLESCSEGLGLEIESTHKNVDTGIKSMSQPLPGLELNWTKKPNLKKGSFLSRGGQMLSKLAEVTKSGDPVSNVKVNSRNFVFSHITPPNPEKTDGSTSRVKRLANSKACGAQAKKTKIDRSFNVFDERSKGSIFKHF